ncbi:MAG: HAD-IC family P-type ATPase [Clostridiales bacterium]|jgi:Ca2+-transporting ATPase|nr:HAD-IC family P-type ATPase [Clostridiales bacterium]
MTIQEPLWYQLEIKQAFEELNSSPDGLTQSQVTEKLESVGPNEIEDIDKISLWQVILDQFKDPLIYILLIAAVVTTALGEFIDTYVILAVVLVNAIIGFTQEYKAEQAIRALAELASPRSLVVRDGKTVEIDSRELVPGDVVLLSSGSRTPADMRLVDTIQLDVDESPLTGESTGVRKMSQALKEEDLAVADRKNLAYMGTVVLSGRGTGLVYATGARTQIGMISEKVKQIDKLLTPLQLQFAKLGKLIGALIVALSAVAFIIGFLTGRELTEILLTAIALAVAAIPEGLPIVFTLTLAVGVSRMAERNAIVRHLPSVETLGSCSIIASDKTGTLTKNQMTVQRIYAGNKHFSVSGTGYAPAGKVFDGNEQTSEVTAGENVALRCCLLTGLLANESDLVEKDNEFSAAGDPTETALIVSALKGGLNRETIKKEFSKLDEIPFESENFYMAVLTTTPALGKNMVWVKGAPERLLEMCADTQINATGDKIDLNKDEVLKLYREMGEEGLRVLAMAYKPVDPGMEKLEKETVESELIFAGLQGLLDPPREEAMEAIRKCKKAGIRVLMVTGDHQVTAVTIAKKIGITDGDDIPVLTGRDIDNLSDDELYEQVGKVSIYARVSPFNKLQIVEQLLRRGEVVAVTGDGVNDAPALKAAHIGVAMGKSGTDVAKETSDIIVTDDNFASIFAAVEEGRVVFSNLRKATFFLLSTGSGVILLILLILGLGLPLPFRPAQILWLNLVTNGLQDVALAFEPKEDGILDLPPRSPKEPIISRLMMGRLVFVGFIMMGGTLATFLWQLRIGANIDQARTVALTTMVVFQMFHVFNARSELTSVFRVPVLSNKFLFYSVIAAFTAHISVIYLPPLQAIFRTTALNATHWIAIIAAASLVIVGEELEKGLRRMAKQK